MKKFLPGGAPKRNHHVPLRLPTGIIFFVLTAIRTEDDSSFHGLAEVVPAVAPVDHLCMVSVVEVDQIGVGLAPASWTCGLPDSSEEQPTASKQFFVAYILFEKLSVLRSMRKKRGG
jgi:hypothetical protein